MDSVRAGLVHKVRLLTTRMYLNRYVFVVALLALYWVMAVSAVRQKSPTFDELPHLTAGYSYWTLKDFRLHPENGALPQRWASLPLLWDAYQVLTVTSVSPSARAGWKYRVFYTDLPVDR